MERRQRRTKTRGRWEEKGRIRDSYTDSEQDCPSADVTDDFLSSFTIENCSGNLKRKLLMSLHPDKNKGCVSESTKKFRTYRSRCENFPREKVKDNVSTKSSFKPEEKKREEPKSKGFYEPQSEDFYESKSSTRHPRRFRHKQLERLFELARTPNVSLDEFRRILENPMVDVNERWVYTTVLGAVLSCKKEKDFEDCDKLNRVKLLLRYKANPNAPFFWLDTEPKRHFFSKHSKMITPLHKAVMNGLFDVADVLIQAGADVNGKDEDGETPIFRAVDHWNPEKGDAIMRLLLRHGAKVNIKSKWLDQFTPLHLAAQKGRATVEPARILLENGANPNITNLNKETPLHILATGNRVGGGISGERDQLINLINYGANINLVNRWENRRPIDIAKRSRDFGIHESGVLYNILKPLHDMLEKDFAGMTDYPKITLYKKGHEGLQVNIDGLNQKPSKKWLIPWDDIFQRN